MLLLMARGLIGFPLTMGEVNDAVAGCVPRMRPDLLKRRLDLWAANGILRSLGPVHVGSGNRRSFDPETVYYAAVLLKITQFGSNIEVLRAIVQTIAAGIKKRERFDLWEQAKVPGNVARHGPVWAALGIELGPDGDKPVATWIDLKNSPGGHFYTTPSFAIDPRNKSLPDHLTLVNLTEAFHGVRTP